ncbi:hypothetical protein C3747_52g54 [Trypanosoma cruzi]|uniref:Uncharacterized protein n=1 Tax=Trypanosoma cruzi TaxID=5693 RepID=A0A2V2WVN2_TRYCR|nr:hypothetical protein C3747_52g54 [Trypanosoma cruzi]
MMAFRDWPTRCLDGRKPLLPCAKRVGLLPPRCVKPSFLPCPHGWTFAEASCERLSAISRAAAVKAPKRIWTHEMVQAEAAAEAAHEAHTLPFLETCHILPNVPEKREERNQALRRCFAMLLEARVEKLGASPSPSWRDLRGVAAPHPHPLESVALHTDIGRVCALPRQQANLLVLHFVRVSRATLPYTAAVCCCTPLVPGDWEMDRPLTPYELDVAIRDSSLGSAPGHDDMLNEFLHRLRSVACGTLRTMIHNSFANGSPPGSWKMGDAIPIPNLRRIHAAQRVPDLSNHSLCY